MNTHSILSTLLERFAEEPTHDEPTIKKYTLAIELLFAGNNHD